MTGTATMNDICIYVWSAIVLIGMAAGLALSWWSTRNATRWARGHSE